MSEPTAIGNGDAGQTLAPVSLLAAFVEYEEYIADECAALKSSPMTYHPDDRIGLPYILEAVQKIRQDCESRQAANAGDERLPANNPKI